MVRDRKLTPAQAVLYGHLTVTLPALLIQAGVTIALAAVALIAVTMKVFWVFTFGCVIALAAGLCAGWTWWSAGIRRWRKWIEANSADSQQVEALAVRTGLVWRNRRFERTSPST
jgi:hypothetical protein